MSAIPTLCLLDLFQIFCGPKKFGLGSKHIIRKFVATPTDLEVMFMPRFVIFFYESWKTNNQYSCAQYTVYSVHEYFTLSCHLPMSLKINEFQKRQRAEICQTPSLPPVPRPIKPKPLRSLNGGSLADSVGFMAATSQPRLDDLDFSESTTREQALDLCFIQPTSTSPVLRWKPTTPSQFEKPSKHLFTCDFCLPLDMFRILDKLTCWSSSLESPTFKNFKNNLKLNQIYQYVSHSQPKGTSNMLVNSCHRWRSCHTQGISKDLWDGKSFQWGRDEQKHTSLQLHCIIPALLARAKFCLQHCKPWGKARNNGRFRSRSFDPWFFKTFRCTEPSSGFGVL